MTASVPALARTVADLVEEYEQKSANIAQAIADFDAAFDRLGMAATVQGCYIEPVGSKSYLSEKALQKNLLSSGWRAIYNRLDIASIASAKDKQLFDRTLADPPPLTFDNAKATFRDYLERPRFHILRGLAEVFADLDPAYKSHSKVRIGVKGLPKRIILSGWGGYGNYARDKFRDIVNALAAYQGLPSLDWAEVQDIEAQHKAGEDAVMSERMLKRYKLGADEDYKAPNRGMTIRAFANGNCHIFFDRWTLVDINKALAEFYGDVLPDATDDDPAPSQSTALAKDLQFYWSPPDVVAAALDLADVNGRRAYHGKPPEYRILEPSCGDGRILDEIEARGSVGFGFECHAGRAAQARAKGHRVVTANFLEQVPIAEFDKVVMNPPFYGRHYVKHVRHAYKFLKPGGTLVAILPATARYDHEELQGDWRDLPVASFAESGTNVPTVLYRISRPRA